MAKVQLFPTRANVGKDVVTPQYFDEKFAAKLVKTKLWSYRPSPSTQDDINLMVGKAKEEISQDMAIIQAEKERLRKEREELEALRAELLTPKAEAETARRGRPKAEV